MTFTSTLPIAAAGQITRLVDVTVTSDAAHRLVVSWTPHLPNLIDPEATRGSSVLLNGLERLEFSYWLAAPGAASGVWVSRWTGSVPPRLIRTRIVLDAPPGAHFPDIIAAPGRERWRP